MGTLAHAEKLFGCLLESGARAAQSCLSCSYDFLRTAETIPIVVNEIIEKGCEIVGSVPKLAIPIQEIFFTGPTREELRCVTKDSQRSMEKISTTSKVGRKRELPVQARPKVHIAMRCRNLSGFQ